MSTRNLETVRELLNRGANKEAKHNEGNRPLHYASIHGYLQIVQELLNPGAVIKVKDIPHASSLDVEELQLAMGVEMAAAKKALLQWCQQQVTKKFGIQVTDFGKTWRDGNAFLGIVNSIRPGNCNSYSLLCNRQFD